MLRGPMMTNLVHFLFLYQRLIKDSRSRKATTQFQKYLQYAWFMDRYLCSVLIQLVKAQIFWRFIAKVSSPVSISSQALYSLVWLSPCSHLLLLPIFHHLSPLYDVLEHTNYIFSESSSSGDDNDRDEDLQIDKDTQTPAKTNTNTKCF